LGGSALSRFSRDPVTGAFGGFQDCITGDTDVSGVPATTKCTPVAGATAGGGNSGLSGLNSVAVSPDNKTVFATGRFDDDLVRFSRNTATGAVTFQGCTGSDSGAAVCTLTPVNAPNGNNTGLNGPEDLAVSPDSANVYVAGGDGDAISRFKLDPATGAFVGYQDCLTSESTVTGCTFVPGSAPGSDNSPLDGLDAVAVSPNGAAVYTGAGGGDALTRFDRDASTGALSFNSCTTSNTNIGGCAQLPGAVAGGTNTPLLAVESVVASADGKNVYVLGVVEAISRFDVEGQPAVTPPPGNPPSNAFDIAKLKKNKHKGTAKVTVTVPGPGELQLSGKNLKTTAATAPAAGNQKLGVKTKGRLKKKLRNRGKLKITLDITFTPTGGDANTESFGIKLVRKPGG
jgi:DNA-binding beta-propeller fold protein YncE